MDVSDSEQLGGQKLLETVASLTGLPEQIAYAELTQILHLAGQNSGDLTLDGLRAAMLAYLETLDAGITEAGETGLSDAQ
ncbi:MAG TPA: hypothetical protein VJB59_12495 [Bdellovibrionota bacterium]|nr:hypothetical protein [Bdellovibrionota bacterium]